MLAPSRGVPRRRWPRRRWLAGGAAIALSATGSGCTHLVGYCLARSSSPICQLGNEPGWGAGTTLIQDSGYPVRDHFVAKGTGADRLWPRNLALEGGAAMRVSRYERSDFQLVIDYENDAMVDAFLYLRASNPEAIDATTAYRVTMANVDRADPPGSVAGPRQGRVLAPPDQWQRQRTLDVVADGPRLRVRLDGRDVADVRDDQRANGWIAFHATPRAPRAMLALRRVRLRSVQPADR